MTVLRASSTAKRISRFVDPGGVRWYVFVEVGHVVLADEHVLDFGTEVAFEDGGDVG